MRLRDLIMLFRPSLKKALIPVILLGISVIGSLWLVFDNPVTGFCYLIISLVSIPSFVYIPDYLPWFYSSDKLLLSPAGVFVFGLIYSMILYNVSCLISLFYEITKKKDPY